MDPPVGFTFLTRGLGLYAVVRLGVVGLNVNAFEEATLKAWPFIHLGLTMLGHPGHSGRKLRVELDIGAFWQMKAFTVRLVEASVLARRSEVGLRRSRLRLNVGRGCGVEPSRFNVPSGLCCSLLDEQPQA